MLPPIFAILRASAAVQGIVGDPPAVFGHGSAPQQNLKRYVTWFVVADAPENNLSDPPPTDRVTVQLDCWHDTDAGVEALATAVRDAMEAVAHMTGVVVNNRDTETKLFRIALQFDYWLDR